MKCGKVRLLVLTILLITASYIFLAYKISRENDWKKNTSPLRKETVDLLCFNFNLPSGNSLCNGSRDVFALDFVDIAKHEFKPYNSLGTPIKDAATYDDVEKKMGSFKYKCESVTHQADGYSYFVCYYDLRGDRKFVMAIAFEYPEMAVARITSTSRFGD